MSEWWTYRPSDFLMFAPRIYWRLFESINASAGPLVWLLPLAALGLGAWVWRSRSRKACCAALFVSAAAWAWVAWAFLWQRFAPIQWVAEAYAWGFAVQAIGLLALGLVPGLTVSTDRWRRRLGLALGLWALLLHPGLAVLMGRPWAQAELWGLAPDPTAIGSLGLLLLLQAAGGPARALQRALWLLPLAWCLVSAATLATMDEPQALLPLAAALLAVGGLAAARVSRARNPPGAGR